MDRPVTILSLIIISILISLVLPSAAQSQNTPSIVGTWTGYDQTNWQVILIFRQDMTVRVMLREFTWDTPYRIDYSKDPISIDIDDFESEPVTGVNQRNYRLPVTPFLGIVEFSGDGNALKLEGYNGKVRPEQFSKNALTLKRNTVLE